MQFDFSERLCYIYVVIFCAERNNMKIKIKDRDYAAVLARPLPPRPRPHRPNLFFRTLAYLSGLAELGETQFSCRSKGMERLGKREPCLYLMNHSSFIDLKIAAHILYPKPFQIICTQDGFVGKRWLMRQLGCIPKKKFVAEYSLVKDMVYALKTLHSSVLMYPEASYSFDGTSTPLPDSLGQCLKLLKVPVVMIRTEGAFTRDPLYNGLQKRRIRVSAETEYLLSPEEIAEKSPEELNEVLRRAFTVDYFRWQQENRISVAEPYRADFLHRVLYKCPVCGSEEHMHGEGTRLTCFACGHGWELDEYGFLRDLSGQDTFTHVPDWYAWERACVQKEIADGTYRTEYDADICMLADYKSIYRVGSGRLVHTNAGFHLTGCGGALDYTQPPQASYSLYADYYWYEIGDMICIGNSKYLYYCFPKGKPVAVAKARIATEELYRLAQAEKRAGRPKTAPENS